MYNARGLQISGQVNISQVVRDQDGIPKFSKEPLQVFIQALPEEYFGKSLDQVVHGALPDFVKEGSASTGLLDQSPNQNLSRNETKKDAADDEGEEEGDKDEEDEELVPVECSLIDLRYFKFEKKIKWIKEKSVG